jgi:hypothetical protein
MPELLGQVVLRGFLHYEQEGGRKEEPLFHLFIFWFYVYYRSFICDCTRNIKGYDVQS